MRKIPSSHLEWALRECRLHPELQKAIDKVLTQRQPTRKPFAGIPSKKSPPRKHDHYGAHQEEIAPARTFPCAVPITNDHHDAHEEEIALDDTESKAIEMVLESDDLRNALEMEVNTVVTQAVRKICKRTALRSTTAQAQNVARVLFGD